MFTSVEEVSHHDFSNWSRNNTFLFDPLEQGFSTWGACTPGGTSKVSNRREKYIYILFIYKLRLRNPWPGSWKFVSCGKVQILKGYCQSSVGGQRVVLPAQLDTCNCDPWNNLVMSDLARQCCMVAHHSSKLLKFHKKYSAFLLFSLFVIRNFRGTL